MEVLHEGLPAAVEDHETDHGDHARHDDDLSVAEAEQLVANRQRAFGKKNRLTFAARAQLAESVGKSGNSEEAARIYEQLLVDQLAAVGHQSPALMSNCYRAAVWTAYAGRPSPALSALRDLLADEEQILGPDHANTLITRATIAQLMDETGDRDEALDLLRQVSQDQVRVLGSEHPATEATLKISPNGRGDRPRHISTDLDRRCRTTTDTAKNPKPAPNDGSPPITEGGAPLGRLLAAQIAVPRRPIGPNV